MAMVQYRSRGGKSSGKVAKLAKGKDTSTRVLAKSIKALQQKVNKQGIDLYYKNPIADVNIASDCLSFNVCDYFSYVPTFGSSADDDVYNRIKHLSSKMDIYINMYNEYNNTQFTAFLVSLKDEIGSSFNPTTGGLSLTADQHYTKVSTYSGLIHLNPRYFKVHRVKRFIVGNNGTSAGTATAERQSGKSDIRWSWNIRPNRTIVNPVGNWKALRSTLDPSKNYFVLLFNDNSLLDSEFPQLTMNVLTKMRTIA